MQGRHFTISRKLESFTIHMQRRLVFLFVPLHAYQVWQESRTRCSLFATKKGAEENQKRIKQLLSLMIASLMRILNLMMAMRMQKKGRSWTVLGRERGRRGYIHTARLGWLSSWSLRGDMQFSFHQITIMTCSEAITKKVPKVSQGNT